RQFRFGTSLFFCLRLRVLLWITLWRHLILLWIGRHRLLRITLLRIILRWHLVRIGLLPRWHLLRRVSILWLRWIPGLLCRLLVGQLCLTLLFCCEDLCIPFVDSRCRCTSCGSCICFTWLSCSAFSRCVDRDI